MSEKNPIDKVVVRRRGGKKTRFENGEKVEASFDKKGEDLTNFTENLAGEIQEHLSKQGKGTLSRKEISDVVRSARKRARGEE